MTEVSIPPTDDELLLVARHGSGKLQRAVAIAMLAERRGKLDELSCQIGENEPKITERP